MLNVMRRNSAYLLRPRTRFPEVVHSDPGHISLSIILNFPDDHFVLEYILIASYPFIL